MYDKLCKIVRRFAQRYFHNYPGSFINHKSFAKNVKVPLPFLQPPSNHGALHSSKH